MENNFAAHVKLAITMLIMAQLVAITAMLVTIGGTVLHNNVNQYATAVNMTKESIIGSINNERSINAAAAYRILQIYRANIAKISISYLNGVQQEYVQSNIEANDNANWDDIVEPMLREAYKTVKVRAALDKVLSTYSITIEEVY